MKYIVMLTEHNLLPVPSQLISELGWELEDILILKVNETRTEIKIEKHIDQTLTDSQILQAGNLTRLIEPNPNE